VKIYLIYSALTFVAVKLLPKKMATSFPKLITQALENAQLQARGCLSKIFLICTSTFAINS